MKHFRIQRYFSNCWSFIDGIEYNSYEDAEKAIKEHYPEQNARIINTEKEIDCSYTDEIVCPHCGYEFGDSWEIFSHDYSDCRESVECCECGKEFDVERRIEVTYSSYKKK